MNSEKVLSDPRFLVSVALLGITGMVLSSHQTGQIYPGLLIFFFLGAVTLIIATNYIKDLYSILGSAILLSVGFRLVSMEIPASAIGDDPNSNIIWIEDLIEAGTTEAISSGFYADAPLHYLLGAIASILLGIEPSESLKIYAIIIGIIAPLVAVLMTRLIGVENIRLLALAGILGVVTTEAVRRTYWPIAQTHASIFWWLFLLVLGWHIRSATKRFYALLILLVISIAFTHKLPLPIIVAVGGILLILHYTDRLAWNQVDQVNPVNQVFGILILISAITVAQWLYARLLLDQIVLRVNEFVIGLTEPSGTTTTVEPTAAVPARPGLLAELYQYPIEYALYFERIHAIILLLASGAGWAAIYLFERDTKHRSKIHIILSSASICVILIAFGQVAVGAMNPTRPLLLGEPIFIALIVGLLHVVYSRYEVDTAHSYSHIIFALLVLLVVSQVFVASAAADYPNTPRYYLDEPEVQSAETMCTYNEEEVYVDQEYAAFTSCGNFERTSRTTEDPLYNAEIEPTEHGVVVYRHNVDVYLGLEDRWRLTWEPSNELPQEYHTVYDNGAVSTYHSPS
ncbi:hypothetical protein [Halalkalicoccus tibetensis]|uniref:Glycosyltransferase RgtA/B/C/D-like domain-containing protein n=1 Tax=Halalkalicoccus tibetensis TaxID=175632 RepID=A0ABD5V6S7_9EURY